MKKLLLSLVVVATGFWANSQVSCVGVSPAPITGSYTFTWADPAGNDWATPDFLIAGTFIEDTLMLAEDGTPGVNPQGIDSTYEACSPLINDLTGKIAVLYRNTCNFSTKALNAQNAGAVGVIIINRDEEAIAMGGGADGTSVTIPVIMLSKSDGAALIAQMSTTDVVMFIGNKLNLHTNDIGSTKDFVQIASFGAETPLTFDGFSPSIQFYNFGSGNQNNVTVNAKITDASNTSFYDETVTIATMNSGDTVWIHSSQTNLFPAWSPSSVPANGTYTLTYTLSLETPTVDEDDFDNIFSSDFVINSGTFSLAKVDVNNEPIFTNFPSSTADNPTDYESCMFFQKSNVSNQFVDGVYLPVSGSEASLMDGEEVFVNIYEWNDTWVDLATPGFNAFSDYFQNLTLIRNNSITLAPQDSATVKFFPLANWSNPNSLTSPLELVDDQRYLVCAQTFNPVVVSFGYDGGIDYSGNSTITTMPISPLKIKTTAGQNAGTNWFTGWSSLTTPSIALSVKNISTIGITELNIEGKAFPNPATDVVTIAVEAKGSAVLTVTDISGKIVLAQNVALTNGTSDVNISSLEAGMYVFNVSFENGESSQFNVVKK